MSRDDSEKTQTGMDPDQTIGPDGDQRAAGPQEPDPTLGPEHHTSADLDRTLGPDATMQSAGSRTPQTRSGIRQTMSADGSRIPIGERNLNIAGYEILDELGRGGMGVVYKARDTALNRIVALKMILAGAHASDEAIARFRVEAEAVAQLQHRGIVQVYDVGQADGQPWCALEFIDGGGLDEMMASQSLSVTESVAIVEELAHAMSSAHQAGIVHRDLKPANVLISKAGTSTGSSIHVEHLGQYRPKITDFGLAKNIEQESHQTQTGAIMGTPGYMAPEQARGVKRIGPAADIYSLGAILYHLVTGRPPFVGETPIKTIMQVINDPPLSPRVVNSAIDRDLDTIILKCLDKEPAARYASAEHLAQDLFRYQAGMPIEARPVSGPERIGKWVRRKPWAAALIGLLLLGIAGVIVGGAIFNRQLSAANRRIKDEQKIAVDALAETSRALDAESKALEAESAALALSKAAKQRAELSESESRRRLIDNFVNNALQSMNEHRMLQALPWLSEALVLETDPQRQAIHQLRFNLAVQASPKPERTWLTDAAMLGCEISDNGKQVVSVGADRFIRFYDIASNQLTRVMESPSQIVGFAISGDQRQAIVVSVTLNVAAGDFSTHNYDVQLFDLNQGTALPPFQFTTTDSIRFNDRLCAEQGWYLHADQETRQLRLIDLRTLDEIATLPAETGIEGVRIDRAGTHVAVDSGKDLTVWDLAQPNAPLLQLPRDDPDGDRAFAFDFGKDHRLVVVDRTIRIYQLPQASAITEIGRGDSGLARFALGPADSGFAVAWPGGQLEIFDGKGLPVDKRNIRSQLVRMFYSEDGQELFVATTLEVLRFDTRTGRPTGSPIPSMLKPLQLADFNDTNGLLAICSGSGAFTGRGCLRLWNIRDRHNRYSLPWPEPETRVEFMAVDRTGNQLATVSNDGTKLTVFDITRRSRPKITHRTTSAAEKIRSSRWSPDGQRLAVAYDNRVSVLQMPGGKVLGEFELNQPRQIRFNRDGSRLAVSYGDDGKLVAIADANNGQMLVNDMQHKRRLEALQFVSQDRCLATVSIDLNLRLFDVATGTQIEKTNLRMRPTSSSINSQGTLVAVSGERLGQSPGRISILDVISAEPVMDPLDFESVMSQIKFSPDGTLLAVADVNGLVRILQTADGVDRGLQLVHPDAIRDMQFSHDNRLLMTVCRDQRARLFDVASGVPIGAPAGLQFGPKSGIRAARFLGKTYDIVELNETALIWQIGNRRFSAKHASTVSRFLSGSIISNQGTIVPTPTQSLKEDFSDMTMNQILDNHLIRHLIPK